MKNYCEKCQQDTNHVVIKEEVVIQSLPDDYNCEEHYMIIKCSGCENISFRYEFHDEEESYIIGDDWYTPVSITTYPKVIKDHRQIQGLSDVPEIVKEAYIQSVAAFREDAKILAGLGFRSVIEAICNDQNITGKNLQERINIMAETGVISKSNAKLLHAIRFLGNDAAHEIKSPNENALNVTLKIVEHMIQSLYILENEANGTMDTLLDASSDLIELISTKIEKMQSGDEVPLAKILGKDIRRFSDNLAALENQLMEDIANGKCKILRAGKMDYYNKSKGQLRHYIVA